MGKRTESERTHGYRPNRRQFVRAVTAAGAVPMVATATAQEGDEEADIVLDGDTPGWEGVSPEEIAGETNPTLSFEAGETYVLEWENIDGQPHNVIIEDAEANAVVETEIISERGATQTVEFQATPEMSEYYCQVHPVSMRGDVEIGEASDEDGEAGEGEDNEEITDNFFPDGPSVGVTTVAEGMTGPTDFAAPPGADDRLFVTDQTGELWVADDDGRREEPFLDVSDRMVTLSEEFAGSYANPESDYDERGLLGVEFHPDYENNGLFYLSYSAPPNENTPDGWSHVQVISEFEVPDVAGEDGAGTGSQDDPQAADPDSERRIMTFQSPQYNHNSGPMAFGPDGYLYVPMGDGGGANDEMYGHLDDWYDDNAGGNGQNTSETLLGGIHRIDVDSDPTEHYRTDKDAPEEPEEGEGYAIPDDNPLVDQEGHRPEYYSWGWRNPFGISFDQDERLIVADAGQALFEEANVVEAGGNYGWNVKEGTHCFSTENPGVPPEECPDTTPEDVRGGEELLDPVVEYPHNFQEASVGIVIVGGHVYEGDALDDLEGRYVFGDWTQDVGRAEPLGRVLTATVPDYGDGAGTDDEDDDTEESQEDDDTEESQEDDTGEQEDGQGGADDDETTVPLDDLWEMEELIFEGSEDGNLGRFVRQFGRDPDGEVYVLVNEAGVPEGETGAVLQLVPPGEGEELETGAGDEDDTGTDDDSAGDDDEDGDDGTGSNGDDESGDENGASNGGDDSAGEDDSS